MSTLLLSLTLLRPMMSMDSFMHFYLPSSTFLKMGRVTKCTHALPKSLILCRLVHSGRQMTALSGNEVLTFGLRSGTRTGVEAHTFRVETQRDLSTWSRAVVQAAHNAAVLIKEVSCSK